MDTMEWQTTLTKMEMPLWNWMLKTFSRNDDVRKEVALRLRIWQQQTTDDNMMGFDLHGKVRVACTDGQKTRVCAVVRQDQSVDTWWYMKRSCKKGLQPSSAHHTHPLLNTCSTLQCAKHAPFLRHAKLLNSKHLSQEPESCSARLGQSELLWQFEVKTHGGCSRLLGPRWD